MNVHSNCQASGRLQGRGAKFQGDGGHFRRNNSNPDTRPDYKFEGHKAGPLPREAVFFHLLFAFFHYYQGCFEARQSPQCLVHWLHKAEKSNFLFYTLSPLRLYVSFHLLSHVLFTPSSPRRIIYTWAFSFYSNAIWTMLLYGDLDKHLGGRLAGGGETRQRWGRKPSDSRWEVPRGGGDHRAPLSGEFSRRLTGNVPTVFALATCAISRDVDANLEGGVKSASLSGGWEYPWRNYCARLGHGRWALCLDLAIFPLLRTETKSSFSREPVLRALWGPVCLCVCMCVGECEYGEVAAAISESLPTLPQGWILRCRSRHPELPRGLL